MRASRLLLISSLLLAPILANASSCEDITEQIKQDTTRYGDAITKQQLPWMCLKWLQKNMGTGSTKKTTTNQKSYTWACSGDSDSKLTILTDSNDKLLQVDGQYSSERGAGIFSTPVNATCPTKNTATVATNNTPPEPTPTTNTTTASACDSTAEQIYDIAAMSAIHPYAHPPFPWENKDWLEKSFGKPKMNVSAANTVYTWHCQNDVMTTIAYNEIKPGPHTQLTTLCKGSQCFLATISRDKNFLHGSLKIIAPKPT